MYIGSTSMVCPIGFGSAAACTAKRAGISAFKKLPYFDNQGEPILGAVTPGLGAQSREESQLIEMLVQALSQVMEEQPEMNWHNVALLVGLAEPDRPNEMGSLAQTIIGQVSKSLNTRYSQAHSQCYVTGHTAAFELLVKARTLLDDPAIPSCIVCCVDSLIDPRTLSWLDGNYRLKTPANRDGLIPGEAAAAVLLQSRPSAKKATEIVGLGFGKEEAPILSGEPLQGKGIAQAARAALSEARLGLHEIECRFSDVTGELWGFKELLLLEANVMRVVRKKEQPLWHWSDSIGDCGAAAGLTQLIWADHAFRTGYAPGANAICLSSAEKGARAAAVLRFHPA